MSRDPARGHDVQLLLAERPEDVAAAREAATLAPAAATRVLAAAGVRGADASECGRGSRRSAAPAGSSWLVGKKQRGLLEATGTSMLTLNGIGLSGAARLLIDVGNNTRLPTKGHFASWNGTALLDVSPGTGLGRGVVHARDSHVTCDGFGRGACVGCAGRKPLATRRARRARSGDTTSVKGVKCRPGSDLLAWATTRVTGTRTVQAR